jgi:hypothetical protein
VVDARDVFPTFSILLLAELPSSSRSNSGLPVSPSATSPCPLQTGARSLCFTTPARIALRSALLPMMYILLGIYFLMTTCMLAQAVFLWCCFRK